MSILNRNSVLTGSVDAFCLVCEAHLRSDDDALHHIAKPIHKKNLDATSFLDKFKEDYVRKVKKGYFCEFCNVFMKTAAKVGPHVAEPKHCANKATQPLKREGNGVLAFNKALIPDNAWHGIIDDTCTVCDAEFDSAPIHKTETAHVLNLVLVEIEFDGENVYRKVDDSTFQCLTCNLVCAQNTITTHFDEPEHKNLYQLCCDAAIGKANEPKETPKTVKDDKQTKENGTSEKEDPKNGIIKKEDPKKSPEKVKPQKPDVEKPVEQPIHIPDTVKKQEVKKTNPKVIKDKAKEIDQEFCKTLGATEFVTRDISGQQWCILCDWGMDEGAVLIHLRSQHHLTMLRMHQKRTEEKLMESDKETSVSEANSKADNKNKILDAANEFQKNNIKLNFVEGLAYCGLCWESIKFEFDLIKNHINEHKKKPAKAAKVENVKPSFGSNLPSSPTPKDDSKSKQQKETESRASSAASAREADGDVENFAKLHNLTYNRKNNIVFCRVCVSKVPASLKNMKEHVNGASHKNKVAKVDVKPSVTAVLKKPSSEFIESVSTIENMFTKDIIINEKYCVNIMSFFMFTLHGTKLRCQACEVNVSRASVDAHKNTPRHERTLNDAPVVYSEETEFIREIRPNIFHCGFCNQLEMSWRTMDLHLKSTVHRESKIAANWRLQEYSSILVQNGARTQMGFMLFSRMLIDQMFNTN